MKDERYLKARDHALRLLSFRPRSRKEMEEKLNNFLEKRKFPSGLLTEVIHDLEEEGLIDDRKFCEWWITQRRSFKPKGNFAIKNELQQKGLPVDVIESLLKREQSFDQYQLAMQAIQKKFNLWQKRCSSRDLKVKITSLLARRGFDWETIHRVIDSLTQKNYNK